jgi:hypothetical protein
MQALDDLLPTPVPPQSLGMLALGYTVSPVVNTLLALVLQTGWIHTAVTID